MILFFQVSMDFCCILCMQLGAFDQAGTKTRLDCTYSKDSAIFFLEIFRATQPNMLSVLEVRTAQNMANTSNFNSARCSTDNTKNASTRYLHRFQWMIFSKHMSLLEFFFAKFWWWGYFSIFFLNLPPFQQSCLRTTPAVAAPFVAALYVFAFCWISSSL